MASGSFENFANIQIYDSNTTDAQKWIVSHDENGYVSFLNKKTGKALDVSGGSAGSGKNISQYTYNSTRAQKWIIIPSSSNGFNILSALPSQYCLDIANGGTQNKTNVQLFRKNNTSSQNFAFISSSPYVEPCSDMHLENSWYTISSSLDSNLVLDVASGSRKDGANIRLYEKNNTFAQLFRFDFIDGYYQIVCAQSGKNIDVDSGDVIPGTNVQQWTGINNKNQLFSAVLNADGSYTFINAATGLALDICGGNACRGANLQAYTPNGTTAQNFILSKCTNLLADGIYTIESSLSIYKLDVQGGAADEGTNIQLWSDNGSLAQKWQISCISERENTYTIQSLSSGLYLSADSNGNVCQRAFTQNENQYWIPFLSDGFIVLQNCATGQVLDVTGASARNGTNIQVYSSNQTAAQKFSISLCPVLSNGTYYIRAIANRNFVLDVSNGSRTPGANVQIWQCNYSGAQKWNISGDSSGIYTITNARSGKALDVHNAQSISGTNVKQWTVNNSSAQKWKIEYSGNGSFKIISLLDSSLALDISGGNLYSGANIQVYTDNNTSAQKFTFEKTTYSPEPVNLSVPCIMQYPELPTGCESVALTNTLSYHGFNLSKTTMADQFIPRSTSDFVTAFWGNPHSSNGNCCSAPAITNAANNYLISRMSSSRAYDVTGSTFQKLLSYLDDGYPVIIWTTINQAPLGTCYASQWYNGRLYQTFTNSHTVVLKGYDRNQGVVYLADSISGYLTESINWINFLYAGRGFQAVVIY